MASFKLNTTILVEGDTIVSREDAIREIQIMLNDYEDNNADKADIIIKLNE